MKLATRVAALAPALGLGACTTLLGVDGDYAADAGGDGGGSAANVASNAASVNTSTADATSTGGGSSASASVGGGGGGGGGACPLCVIDERAPEAGGTRPRLAHPSPFLRYTFLRDDTVQERTPGGMEPAHRTPGVVSATLATAAAGDGAQLLWTGNPQDTGLAELFGATTSPVAVWGAHFDATLAAAGVYVATHQAEDGQPVLLLCEEGGCSPHIACADGAIHPERDVALARREETIAYARRCNGDLVVTTVSPEVEALRVENLPFEEIALALGPGDVPTVATVATIRDGVGSVQVVAPDDVEPPVVVPSAARPAVVATAEGTLVVVESGTSADEGTLGAVFCGPLPSDGCAPVELTGADLTGATNPSLGLVGESEVWLAWEQGGNIHVGQLGP